MGAARRPAWLAVHVLVVLAVAGGSGQGATIYSEDFSPGSTEGWSGTGGQAQCAAAGQALCGALTATCCYGGVGFTWTSKAASVACFTGITARFNIDNLGNPRAADAVNVFIVRDGTVPSTPTMSYPGDTTGLVSLGVAATPAATMVQVRVMTTTTSQPAGAHVISDVFLTGTAVGWSAWTTVSTTQWSAWTSAACGSGEQRTRTRSQTRACSCGSCSGSSTRTLTTPGTRVNCCPGTWSAYGPLSAIMWSAWAPAECGVSQTRTASRSQTRTCTKVCTTSTNCAGPSSNVVPANENRPASANCCPGTWSAFGTPTVAWAQWAPVGCDVEQTRTGSSSKSRTCTTTCPCVGSTTQVDPLMETKVLGNNCCPGTWSAFMPATTWAAWSPWSPAGCGVATARSRTRSEERTCTRTACPTSTCAGIGKRTRHEFEDMTAAENCCGIVNGAWSMWQRSPQMWGMWSSGCDMVQRRSRRIQLDRTCTAPAPACNGTACPESDARSEMEEDTRLVCCPESYANTESTCAACTVCVAGEINTVGCSQGTNRECASCDPGATFAATATTCAPCTVCPSGTFAVTPCAAAADTVCRPCSAAPTCGAGNYARACGGSLDTTCTSCTDCPSGTFAAAECHATADTLCASCTVCPSGTFAVTPCAAATNTVCRPCSAAPTCGPREYVRACGGALDAACVTCGECGEGQAQTAACSATTDTVCAPVSGSTAGSSGSLSTVALAGGVAGGLLALLALLVLVVALVRRRRPSRASRTHLHSPAGPTIAMSSNPMASAAAPSWDEALYSTGSTPTTAPAWDADLYSTGGSVGQTTVVGGSIEDTYA